LTSGEVIFKLSRQPAPQGRQHRSSQDIWAALDSACQIVIRISKKQPAKITASRLPHKALLRK